MKLKLTYTTFKMDGEIAWKRAKAVEKELESLAEKVKPFVGRAKTHQEAVDMLVQSLYETLTGFKGKSFPENWEHAHNQTIMCFRLYYDFDVLDQTFPAAVSPRDLVVPLIRPEKAPPVAHVASAAPFAAVDASEPQVDVAALLGEAPKPAEERRRLLQEVKDHLELLKEFEGIVPEAEIADRKRELFAILPSMSAVGNKKAKSTFL